MVKFVVNGLSDLEALRSPGGFPVPTDFALGMISVLAKDEDVTVACSDEYELRTLIFKAEKWGVPYSVEGSAINGQ